MAAYPTGFSVLLKRFRGRAGLTQETLAERTGLSVTGISKIERGIYPTPRCETIQLLADALSLTIEERVSLEQAASRSTLLPTLPKGDQTVSLSAVLQAISSLADLPGNDTHPPTGYSA
jgi:transcriptional regulator with XRE-family HTH domain